MLLLPEGRTCGLRDLQVPGLEVIEAAVPEGSAALVSEDRSMLLVAAFLRPRVEVRDRVPAQRDAALLKSFAVTAQMGAITDVDINTPQDDDLRGRTAVRSALCDSSLGELQAARKSLGAWRTLHVGRV